MQNSFLTTTAKEVFDVIYTHENGQHHLVMPLKPYTKEALESVLKDWWTAINSFRQLTPMTGLQPFAPQQPPTLMKISVSIITDRQDFLNRYDDKSVLQWYYNEDLEANEMAKHS